MVKECMVSCSSLHRMPRVNSSRLQINQEMQIGNIAGGLIKFRLLRGINESNAVEFQGAQDEIGLQNLNMNGGETLLMDLIRPLSLWPQVYEIGTTHE